MVDGTYLFITLDYYIFRKNLKNAPNFIAVSQESMKNIFLTSFKFFNNNLNQRIVIKKQNKSKHVAELILYYK
jgi:hypothetical protein